MPKTGQDDPLVTIWAERNQAEEGLERCFLTC